MVKVQERADRHEEEKEDLPEVTKSSPPPRIEMPPLAALKLDPERIVP